MDQHFSPQAMAGEDSNRPVRRKRTQQICSTRRRSKTGCLTCRQRRIKCDEAKPTCKNCEKSRRPCAGYQPPAIRCEPMHLAQFSSPNFFVHLSEPDASINYQAPNYYWHDYGQISPGHVHPASFDQWSKQNGMPELHMISYSSYTSPREKSSSAISPASEGERSYIGRSPSRGSGEEDGTIHRKEHLLASGIVMIMLRLIDRYERRFVESRNITQRAAHSRSQSTAKHAGAATRTSTKPYNARCRSKAVCSAKAQSRRKDEDEEAPQDNPNPDNSGTEATHNGRIYACPYNKAMPLQFSHRNTAVKDYRSCSTVLLTDIARLKQHLYRVHKRPDIYCPTCFSTFDTNAESDIHVRQRSCEACHDPFNDRMLPDVSRKIKRKKREPKGLDLEGKEAYRRKVWFEIFGLLFPLIPPHRWPESPYANNAECVLHVYNIFVALGAMAQEVFNTMHASPSGVILPEVTRDVVQEAYAIFLHEVNPESLTILFPEDVPHLDFEETSGYSTASASSQLRLENSLMSFTSYVSPDQTEDDLTFSNNYQYNSHGNIADPSSLGQAQRQEQEYPSNLHTVKCPFSQYDHNAQIFDYACDQAIGKSHDLTTFDFLGLHA